MVEKTPGSSATFEEKVNALVDQRLKDPTVLPAEYRAWLPRFIETQNIQVPVSQISGANLTATDTEGLGGDVHGRVGMVRGGTTPYDFTQLTYDSVYGKWVSSAHPVFASFFTAAFTTTSTTYVQVQPPFVETYLNYGSFTAAGLVPQFRIIGRIRTSNASHTTSLSMWFATATVGGALTATVNAAWAATTVSTNATGVIADSGWNGIPAVTAGDFMYCSPIAKISNGASTASVFGHQGHLRWVSA